MPVSDLPAGEWTPLLIGDQWPAADSLTTLSQNGVSRNNSASRLGIYAELLQGLIASSLGLQEGSTAEDARYNFRRGVALSRENAEKNLIKSGAYHAAAQHVGKFRSELRNFAAEGNDRIEAINRSSTQVAEKILAIIEVISEIRKRSALSSAACAGEIYFQIQAVLSSQGVDESARAFAASNGFAAIGGPATKFADLRNAVRQKLEHLGAANGATSDTKAGSAASATEAGSDLGESWLSETSEANTLSGPTSVTTGTGPGERTQFSMTNGITSSGSNTTEIIANAGTNASIGMDSSPATSPTAKVTNAGTNPRLAVPTDTTVPNTAPGTTSGVTSTGASPPTTTTTPSPTPTIASSSVTSNPTSTLTSPDLGSTPSLSAPAAQAPGATPSIDAHSPTATEGPAALNISSNDLALSPNDLAQGFNTGNQSGAPVSASAETLSTAPASAVHTPPPAFTAAHADPGVPAAPVLETAHAAPAPAAPVAPAPVEVAQPVVAAAPAAAPIAPPPPAGPIVATPPTPPSGLMGYGADLRPSPAAVTPAAPPAAPSSAPVSPASGSPTTGQPAVVRQRPAVAAAAMAPAGLVERAFTATATGAAAGATTARAQAVARLRGLLDSVARQRPEVRWAIADLEGGGTVVATDLAGGWVPPGIDIPTGVRLPQPGASRKTLTSLLGTTTLTVTHEPGQRPRPDGDPPQTSVRARDTPPVADLGWELSQATRWRDGLPRLAHTLARAVSAKTGWLDSEADLLRQHLDAVAGAVLRGYPGGVSREQVGNWQLLATIEALINGEKTAANYHFAWFQAQALTREGHQ